MIPFIGTFYKVHVRCFCNVIFCANGMFISFFKDNTPPTIFNCPDDITVDVPVGQTSASVTWVEPIAVDDNVLVTFVSRSHAPNSVFTLEKTVVTYIYEDNAGNTAECAFCVNLVFGRLKLFQIIF